MESYDVVEWGQPLQKALRATPVPSGREVLVKLKYCGVCHSDVHIRDGYFELGNGKRFNMHERGMKLPITMGHEPYGTVVAAGPDSSGAPIGQDRLVYPWTGCGQCARCAEGMDNWCPQPRYLGVQRPGGYADYLLVPDAKYLVDVSGIDPVFAPILACSGLTTYSAIQKLKPCAATDWILILGAGGLGLMAVSVLRALGHQNIAVADIDSAKWPAATALGASLCLDPTAADAGAQLQALAGGLWGAIDFVGANGTASVALTNLRKGGRYIAVGLFGGELQQSIVPMIQRALTIQGSYVGSLAELREVVALARTGKLQPIPMATCSLDEVSGVLDRLKAGTVSGRVVAKIG